MGGEGEEGGVGGSGTGDADAMGDRYGARSTDADGRAGIVRGAGGADGVVRGAGGADGTGDTDPVAAAIAGELTLLRPEVRASRALAARLLDPEFVEVGASGRRYDRAVMLAELPRHPGGSADGPVYRPSGITGVLLAPDLVHLTYETRLDGRRARHSSLWRRRDEATGWRMYYHQGTPVPPGTA